MSEPQEYTVKGFKPWMDKDDPEEVVRDTHGNYKGSITFEEYASEPVDATFKTIPVPGDKKFGTIDDYKTKSGSTRQKFTRADRPEYTAPRPSQKPQAGAVDWNDKDASIRAQMAIKTAVVSFGASLTMADIYDGELEKRATAIFAMVDRVKVSNKPEPVAPSTSSSVTPAPRPKSFAFDDSVGDEPINLDDIPFN